MAPGQGGKPANQVAQRPPADQEPPSGPRFCKHCFQPMDTSRLLLAFLAFGAACTTLWAWMLAASTGPSQEQR